MSLSEFIMKSKTKIMFSDMKGYVIFCFGVNYLLKAKLPIL